MPLEDIPQVVPDQVLTATFENDIHNKLAANNSRYDPSSDFQDNVVLTDDVMTVTTIDNSNTEYDNPDARYDLCAYL